MNLTPQMLPQHWNQDHVKNMTTETCANRFFKFFDPYRMLTTVYPSVSGKFVTPQVKDWVEELENVRTNSIKSSSDRQGDE